MEYVYALISSLFPDPAMVRLVFVVLIGTAVFVLALAIVYLVFSPAHRVKRRIRALSDDQIADHFDLDLDKLKSDNVDRVLDPLEKYLTPQKHGERVAMQERLRHAGFFKKSALARFYAIKTLLGLGLPLLALMLMRYDPSMSTGKALYFALMATAAGMFAPNYVLEYLSTSRQTRLRNSFPDMLDLLVVCVESGMGLDAALHRVADSIDMAHPELGEELALVNSEIRMGVTRSKALQQMVNRTGLKEIRGLVAVLDQSVRFGTKLADSLRAYSEDFRDRRVQDAEEKAAKIGAKLLFPMLVCIWPAFFVVAVGPAVLKVMEAMEKMNW